MQERLALRVQGTEAKLKRLRRERLETYDAGRNAGCQPGELDGRRVWK